MQRLDECKKYDSDMRADLPKAQLFSVTINLFAAQADLPRRNEKAQLKSDIKQPVFSA